MNGSKIEYYASIKFSYDIYHQMKNEQLETIHRERKEHQDKQGNNYGGGNKIYIEHMQRETCDIKYQVYYSVPVDASTGPRSHVIQVKTHGTIMGGRNEQAKEHRNRNIQFSDRSIASVKTSIRRQIGLVSENHQQPEPVISAANERNTNANTCCLRSNFIVLEYTTRTADVFAHDKEISQLNNESIIIGATSWDDLVTG